MMLGRLLVWLPGSLLCRLADRLVAVQPMGLAWWACARAAAVNSAQWGVAPTHSSPPCVHAVH